MYDEKLDEKIDNKKSMTKFGWDLWSRQDEELSGISHIAKRGIQF